MRDPFAQPPSLRPLGDAVRPWADHLEFPLFAVHVHEVLAAALFYTFVQVVVSPWLSGRLLPSFYPRHSSAKKANWDIHLVSLVQSVVINPLAVWVMLFDQERKLIGQHWQTRVWAYTGASGLVQAMFVGYFVWDLVVTLMYFHIFSIGLLAHGVSALLVYSCGFRPYLSYWGPVFILYELSTPFLNIHWFFDKLNMTGSRAQLVNGVLLLTTFFLCRLVWGTYNSVILWGDIWRGSRALANPEAVDALEIVQTLGAAALFPRSPAPVPVWMGLVNVLSNLFLNALNWHWFFKMISAVRKRFVSPPTPPSSPPYKTGSEKIGAGADLSEGASTGKARTKTDHLLNRRRYSIEQVVQEIQPDSDELRDGTIQ